MTTDLDWLNEQFEEDEDLALLCRDLMITHGPSDDLLENPIAKDYWNHLQNLDREDLTTLALGMSLCPLHMIDYAICFEYENPDCAAIRIIHPGYDT